MSLVFAALVPHPPIILPAIGREHSRSLDKTNEAYSKLKKSLAESAPDTLLIISPHLSAMQNTFTVNHAPRYATHFLEFGDFSPPREYLPDPLLIERVRHEAKKAGQSIITVSDDHLDYGAGVPLMLLLPPEQKPMLTVVSPLVDGAKEQFAFGQAIKEAIMGAKRRVAVICSGDLSHRLTSDTPNGFSPKAKEFDDLMLANLASGSASPILQMNQDLVEEAHACGYGPICILSGILDRMNCTPELLAYEAPFGVGYCTMEFHLK